MISSLRYGVQHSMGNVFQVGGPVGSAAFTTILPEDTCVIGGFGPLVPDPLVGPWKSASCARLWRTLLSGFTDILSGSPAEEGAGNKSFTGYAVSMISRGQKYCAAYCFHHHQTTSMLCRYRVDAGFRAFCRLTRKGNPLYYSPCGSRTDRIPYPDSLPVGVWLGGSLRHPMAI
jgi:hypothetical protein